MFLHISPEQSVVIIVYLEFKNLINYQVKKVKNESTFQGIHGKSAWRWTELKGTARVHKVKKVPKST